MIADKHLRDIFLSQALERMEERSFTHVIFDARSTKISARDFLLTVIEKDPSIIGLPTSFEPTVDDVFSLLIAGGKGYIVKPFTAGSLDEAICWATKGDPITESVRHSKGRNEALAAVIFASLDKLALMMRQARKFETARWEVPKRQSHLYRAVSIARTFAKGGDPKLREAIVDVALERCDNEPAQIGSSAPRKIKRRGLDKAKTQSTLLR